MNVPIQTGALALTAGQSQPPQDGESGWLYGGAGVDYLQGGEGNDTYVLELGEAPIDPNATEVIDDAQGINTVRFGAGIDAGSPIVQQDVSGQYLLLDYGAGDRLAIRGGFNGAVSRFEFADGTALSWIELVNRRFNDTVTIDTADPGQSLAGGTQDDRIGASGGGSTISGGRGNDVISASGGNNTYLYALGDGSDHVSDTSPKVDGQGNPLLNTLKFGAGIGVNDLRLGLGSLRIQVGADPNDAIHIENFNPDDALASPAIDRFEFADGTWDKPRARPTARSQSLQHGDKSQSPGYGARNRRIGTSRPGACAGVPAPWPPAARGARCRSDRMMPRCDGSSARPASAARGA